MEKTLACHFKNDLPIKRAYQSICDEFEEAVIQSFR